MNGTFSVREHPKGEAVVSTLSLPHDGVIRVEAGARFIRFKAGTELALVNVEEDYLDPLLMPARLAITTVEEKAGDERNDRNDEDHFQIYYQLAEAHGVALPVPNRKSRPKVVSSHPIFKKIIRQLKIGCSDTGCC